MKTLLTSADKAEALGFAKFNNGEHLCVDLSDLPGDKGTTISVKLPTGEAVTFAFCSYGAELGCIDIKHFQKHTLVKPNAGFGGDVREMPALRYISFLGGGKRHCGHGTLLSLLVSQKHSTNPLDEV